MTEPLAPADHDHENDGVESLAEVSARRIAARSQWQKALARARDRFAPANLRDEAIDTVAEKVGNAADQAADLARTHRWRIALAALFGGLFFARKPIAKAAAPIAAKAKQGIDKATARLRDGQP